MFTLPVVAVLLASFQQPAPAAEAPKQDPPKQEEQKLQTKGKSSIVFYGFLRLDVIYDTSRPNNTQVPFWIRSDDDDLGKDLTIHPKLTRFGMDFNGPAVEDLGNAKLSGKLEIDFYNATATNSREAIRMRHAYVQLAWDTFMLQAGQREDVISPLFPTVNNDAVMWHAGNLADRRPQVRAEYGSGDLTVTAMIGLTGANDAQDGDSNTFLDGETSGFPTFQARVAYAFQGLMEKKKVVIGAWLHFAKEESDAPVSGEDSWTSNAVGVDLTFPINDQFWIKLEAWSGQNLADVRGGIQQDITGTGDEVKAKGGWLELGFQAMPTWLIVGGIAMDDPDDDDLAATARDRNLVFYIGNRLTYGQVVIGADYLNWTTEFVGPGVDDGTDNRFNFFIQYNF